MISMKIKSIVKFNTLGLAQSIIWCFLLSCSIAVSACGGNENGDDPLPPNPEPQLSQASTAMNELW